MVVNRAVFIEWVLDLK